MNFPYITFSLFAVVAFMLSSCVSTVPEMSMTCEADNSYWNSRLATTEKSRGYYIEKPGASSLMSERNVYPIIVTAFKDSGFNVVDSQSSADYVVLWHMREKHSSVNTVNYIPTFSQSYGTVTSGNSTANYSQNNVGGTYVNGTRPIDIKVIAMTIMRRNGNDIKKWYDIWNGDASAESQYFADYTVITKVISNYGRSFPHGFVQIKQ